MKDRALDTIVTVMISHGPTKTGMRGTVKATDVGIEAGASTEETGMEITGTMADITKIVKAVALVTEKEIRVEIEWETERERDIVAETDRGRDTEAERMIEGTVDETEEKEILVQMRGNRVGGGGTTPRTMVDEVGRRGMSRHIQMKEMKESRIKWTFRQKNMISMRGRTAITVEGIEIDPVAATVTRRRMTKRNKRWTRKYLQMGRRMSTLLLGGSSSNSSFLLSNTGCNNRMPVSLHNHCFMAALAVLICLRLGLCHLIWVL
jgi:hypothetical protein